MRLIGKTVSLIVLINGVSQRWEAVSSEPVNTIRDFDPCLALSRSLDLVREEKYIGQEKGYCAGIYLTGANKFVTARAKLDPDWQTITGDYAFSLIAVPADRCKEICEETDGCGASFCKDNNHCKGLYWSSFLEKSSCYETRSNPCESHVPVFCVRPEEAKRNAQILKRYMPIPHKQYKSVYLDRNGAPTNILDAVVPKTDSTTIDKKIEATAESHTDEKIQETKHVEKKVEDSADGDEPGPTNPAQKSNSNSGQSQTDEADETDDEEDDDDDDDELDQDDLILDPNGLSSESTTPVPSTTTTTTTSSPVATGNIASTTAGVTTAAGSGSTTTAAPTVPGTVKANKKGGKGYTHVASYSTVTLCVAAVLSYYTVF